MQYVAQANDLQADECYSTTRVNVSEAGKCKKHLATIDGDSGDYSEDQCAGLSACDNFALSSLRH